MVNRIIFIRFLQDCCFTLPEIKKLLSLPNDELIIKIENKLMELEDKRIELNKLITKTYEILDKLKDNDSLKPSDIMEDYR